MFPDILTSVLGTFAASEASVCMHSRYRKKWLEATTVRFFFFRILLLLHGAIRSSSVYSLGIKVGETPPPPAPFNMNQ